MDKYFSELYAKLSPEQLEDYHCAVFMNMEGDFAAAKRVEYYQNKLRFMGRNVKIGCGVKILDPQHISLGDGVTIGGRCVLMARSEKGITLAEGVRLKYGVYLDT